MYKEGCLHYITKFRLAEILGSAGLSSDVVV